jgi:hypothetical protein
MMINRFVHDGTSLVEELAPYLEEMDPKSRSFVEDLADTVSREGHVMTTDAQFEWLLDLEEKFKR